MCSQFSQPVSGCRVAWLRAQNVAVVLFCFVQPTRFVRLSAEKQCLFYSWAFQCLLRSGTILVFAIGHFVALFFDVSKVPPLALKRA